MTHEAMAQVAAQREQLAEKARLPWWFWVLFTVATVGLVGGPLFARALPGDVSTYVITWPSILVYAVADRLVRWTRGISLSTRMTAYPSARRPGIAFLLIGIVGIIGVSTLHRVEQLPWAVAVLVLATVLMVGAMVAMQRAMRRDIREGRVRSA
ncbi:hypothetical protein LQ327_29025 [Actinomycetospora endophytica]|uniref:Uncharacterized protein n=1 Tax=Actinomycetospora endophytica TaxID=2291215 RepID=A0ABS8PGN9_9PSEU|nr:hypothetical protein [Actinomycetospora endophytica]MCD2197421.1 hypothetical protein [Actinomycetospora endophytica]